MSAKESRASSWLKQRDPIPEMELHDLIRVLKQGFDILSEIEPRQNNYSVRFKKESPEFRSLRIMTHNRDGVRVSPHCVKHALEKFEISETEFRKSYNRILIGQPFAVATGTDGRKS